MEICIEDKAVRVVQALYRVFGIVNVILVRCEVNCK